MERSDMLHIDGNDRPLLRGLCNHVMRPVAHKYECLGEQLLEAHEVQIITADHPNDVVKCCKCVLQKWLETTEDASWNQLIKALRSPSVQLNSFASQLEQMISTDKLTNIQDIEIQFALISTAIKEALINSRVNVVLLIQRLCAISAVKDKNVPLFDENVFEKIKSIDDFWNELRGLWTIFDYDLLKYIVETSQCNKAQDTLNKFLLKIDPSSIEDVDMMLRCKVEHWEGLLKPVLRIKVNAEKCTPNVKREVEEIVKKTYELDKYALHLVCIKKGCIELFYYISRSLKSYLLQFHITEDDIRNFFDHNFINLRIDDFVLNIPSRIIDITSDSLTWSECLKESTVPPVMMGEFGSEDKVSKQLKIQKSALKKPNSALTECDTGEDGRMVEKMKKSNQETIHNDELCRNSPNYSLVASEQMCVAKPERGNTPRLPNAHHSHHSDELDNSDECFRSPAPSRSGLPKTQRYSERFAIEDSIRETETQSGNDFSNTIRHFTTGYYSTEGAEQHWIIRSNTTVLAETHSATVLRQDHSSLSSVASADLQSDTAVYSLDNEHISSGRMAMHLGDEIETTMPQPSSSPQISRKVSDSDDESFYSAQSHVSTTSTSLDPAKRGYDTKGSKSQHMPDLL